MHVRMQPSGFAMWRVYHDPNEFASPPPPPPPRTNLLKLNHVGFFTIPFFRSHLSDISNDQGSMLADLTLVTRKSLIVNSECKLPHSKATGKQGCVGSSGCENEEYGGESSYS